MKDSDFKCFTLLSIAEMPHVSMSLITINTFFKKITLNQVWYQVYTFKSSFSKVCITISYCRTLTFLGLLAVNRVLRWWSLSLCRQDYIDGKTQPQRFLHWGSSPYQTLKIAFIKFQEGIELHLGETAPLARAWSLTAYGIFKGIVFVRTKQDLCWREARN